MSGRAGFARSAACAASVWHYGAWWNRPPLPVGSPWPLPIFRLSGARSVIVLSRTSPERRVRSWPTITAACTRRSWACPRS